jgi:cytoskeletal protein RodZ
MLISPRKDISKIMDSAAGKFFMVVFLILAIGQNLFLGLFLLVIFIYLLAPNTREGMANSRARTSQRPVSTSKTNEDDPRKQNDDSDVSKTEENVSNDETNVNNKANVELSEEELTIVRNLIHSKQTNPKQKCRKNCGNALLSCLDGCQVSEQMRRPVSSKDVNITKNNDTTENVEPTEEATKEGFATFEQNYMSL